MRPGLRIALTIDRLTTGGDGVARSEGRVVFVPHTAPGDRIEAEITETQPRFSRARLLRVIEPSLQRIDPPCPYHFRPLTPSPRPPDSLFCGGCSWQHLAYEAQLKAKRELVRETLERLGGLKGISVNPVLGMKDPWRYRNKVQQPVGWDGRRLVSGFFAPGSHDILPIEDCLVQPELSVRIINRAKALLEDHGLRVYDQEHHSGWIRHLLVRTTNDRKALLVFVTRTPDFPHEKELVTALAAEFPGLTGIHQNIQPARSNVILGRQWRRLSGSEFLEERLGPLRFRLSPASFFQVNSAQAEVLYEAARRMAGQGERLLDLYTGVGTIALWMAGGFREVGGIEEVRPAIVDAEANAELNGIENVRFQAMPVEAFLGNLGRDAGGSKLTVVLDPPRSGCTPASVQALSRLRPGRIVYVSCDPGTLARDLSQLVKTGYRVIEVQPVDLFPHTPHIETAVHLNDGR